MTSPAEIVSETDPAQAERNTGLAGAFTGTVLKDPTIMDHIPQGPTLTFLPEEDPTISEKNIRLGLAAIRLGDDVLFLHVNENDDGTLRFRRRGERNRLNRNGGDAETS